MELTPGLPDAAMPFVGDSGRSAPRARARSCETIPTFYINRDRDVDRRQSVEAYLSAADLDAERVTAVEGENVPESLRGYFFSGDRVHSTLKPGEIGCYASHLSAMQLVVERNHAYALILEDDAAVPHDIAEILADVLARVPRGWDIVHLCMDSNRAIKVVTPLNGGRRLVRYSRVPETTTGYLVSLAGARKFLTPSKRYWPIDTDFRRPWAFGLDIYGVTPCFIVPIGVESSIHLIGNHSRQRRGLPKPSLHCWTGNPLHTPLAAIFNVRKLGPAAWTICAAHNATRRLVKMLGLHAFAQRIGAVDFGRRIAESLAVR